MGALPRVALAAGGRTEQIDVAKNSSRSAGELIVVSRRPDQRRPRPTTDRRDAERDPPGPAIVRADGEPAWSPDGTRIAFTRYAGDPGSFDIWVMNADGSGQTNLTNSPLANDLDPDWSPDGARITFSSVPAPPLSGDFEIFVMNANGSGRTDLTNSLSANEFHPVSSPDGTKIAFTSEAIAVGANREIFVMNADGSGQTNLTNSPLSEQEPDWLVVRNRLAVRTADAVEIYDTGSGELTARSPAASHLRLEDLDGGILVTASGRTVTLRRISNRRTTTIRAGGFAHAQLERPGLFVAAGRRVTFTPMREVLRRLGG